MILAKIKGASIAIATTVINLNSDELFFTLILATPLVIISRIFPSWEIGKIFTFWTVVQTWFWIRLLTKGVSLPKYLRPVLFSLFFYLLVLLIESYSSGGNAFWGGWWRRQGWWFMVHLGVLFYLVSTSNLDQKFIFRSLKLFLLLTVLFGFFLLPNHQRFSGTLGEANSWGIFAALALVLAIEIKQSRFLSPVFIVGLFLSQSRSAIAALAPLIHKFNWPIKIILFILSLVFFGWFNFVRGSGERLELWTSSFALWQTHPWLGVGLDNFQDIFTKFMKNRGLQWQFYDHPHNLILWLLVSSGAVGFGLFVGWLYLIFTGGTNKIFKQLGISLLIFGLFQPFSTAIWVYFLIFMALTVWKPETQKLTPNPSRSFLYWFWLLLLGVGGWWFIVFQTASQYFLQ